MDQFVNSKQRGPKMAQAYYNSAVSYSIGPTAAIILERIRYFCEQAKRNASSFHYHENRWWIYNSVKEWAESIPGFSERRIQYALKKLEKYGFIKTGRFNRHKYDRTIWYSIVEEELEKFKEGKKEDEKEPKVLKSDILQNCEMQLPNLQNANTEIVEPIPKESSDKSSDKSKKNKHEPFVFINLSSDEKQIVEDLERQASNFRQLKAKSNQIKVAKFYGTYEAYSENYSCLWEIFWQKNKPSGIHDDDLKRASLFIENCILKTICRFQ